MATVPLFFSESKEIKLEKTPRINGVLPVKGTVKNNK